MRVCYWTACVCVAVFLISCVHRGPKPTTCLFDEGSVADSTGRFHSRAFPADSACTRRDSIVTAR